MKVLTATSVSQGLETFDQFTAIEDELVILEECNYCDPNRQLYRGVASNGLTTSAKVSERQDLDFNAVVEMYFNAYDRSRIGECSLSGNFERTLLTNIKQLLTAAEQLPVHTLLRRNKDYFYVKPNEEAA